MPSTTGIYPKTCVVLYMLFVLMNLSCMGLSLNMLDKLTSTSRFSNKTVELGVNRTDVAIQPMNSCKFKNQSGKAPPGFMEMKFTIGDTQFVTFVLPNLLGNDTKHPDGNDETLSVSNISTPNTSSTVSTDTASDYFSAADSMDFNTMVKFWETSVCGKSSVCLYDIKNASASNLRVCDGCFCDSCIYGDCCVDKVLDREVVISPQLKYTSCTTPSKSLLDKQQEGYYIFVTRCPHNYSYGTVRNNCEDPSNQLETITDTPPMYSPTSQISYLNIHCAECHNDIDHLQTWTSQITCTKALIISEIKTMDDLAALIATKYCQLLFDPPKESLFRSCDIGLNQPASECNITGDWVEANKEIETACGMYSNPLTVDDERYRNVFCALCNGKRSSILDLFEFGNTPSIPSFSIIFNFQPKPQSSEISTCPEDSVLVKTGSCRKLVCSPGRVSFNHACVDAFKTAKGLGYRLKFHLLPSRQPILLARIDMHTFWTEYKTHIWFDHDNDLLKFKETLFMLNMTICFRRTLLETIMSVENVKIDLHTVIGGDVSQMQAENTLIQLFEIQWVYDKIVWTPSTAFQSDRPDHDIECLTFSFNIMGKHTPKEYLTNAALFIPLTPLFRCNQTELSPEEYSLNHTTGQLETNVTDMKYQRDEYIIDGDKVRICINVSQLEAEISDFEATMEKLTAVSLGVSICCLCLTIGICLISNSHQTLPGEITMALVLTLIIAQLLFITSSQAFGIIWSCRLFGMVLHYFWLSVFAWKHVAGYHMYMSFVHPLRKLSRQVVTMIRYTMYSFGVPLVIVVCYTTTHLILSNKEHIGYGDDTCFLSGPIDIGVAFALPVSIVIVCNVFFFARVVHAIRKMSEFQKHSNRPNTNHSIIFMKMSAILGFTWIVGFLANVENNHILWYAFTVLNGGIGVFIFLGQVMNRHVIKYICGWFGLSSKRQPVSKSGNVSRAKNKIKRESSQLASDKETSLSKTDH